MSRLLKKVENVLTVNNRRMPRKGKSFRAGLSFPVARIARQLKLEHITARMSGSASVYLTAVLEYLCAEVLELSGNAAKDHNRNRITPRHIQLAIRNDDELNDLFKNITIPSGGVVPNIHSVLLPKKSKTISTET